MRAGEREGASRRLEGRVALVTGAGSIGPGWGNGKAASVLFAREGAKVLALDIDLAAAEETCALIAQEGGEAIPLRADVTKSAEVSAAVASCVEHWGRLDILQNNVGIATVGGPEQTSEEEWDRMAAVNVKSLFLTCKHALPVMRERQSGAVINVASVAALRWVGFAYSAYSTTKAAVLGFTRNLAVELAPTGIRANSVVPGLMNTPMVEASLTKSYGGDVAAMVAKRDAQCPMGRMGDAWDVAYASLFLASDDSRYVTGLELVVDGGLTLRSA